MNKQEFLKRLRKVLPEGDREERLSFYSEMIDDRMEEGRSEEAAVAEIGSIDRVISQILQETAFGSQEPAPSGKRLSGWQLLLLILGSPLWIPLLAAVFAVAVSVYATLWSLVVSAWAVFTSLAASALGLSVAGAAVIFSHPTSGAGLIGAGLLCAGLGILTFLGCRAATTGSVFLTKKIGVWIKGFFTRKEAAV